MQSTLGRLTEAVETLKTQSSAHDDKLSKISADIHTAKITVRIVGVILTAVIAIAGWAINKGVDAFVQTLHATVSAPQQTTQPTQGKKP